MASILTHNGKFTVKSPTGVHKVFEIKTQPNSSPFAPGKRVLHVKNNREWIGIAFIDMDAKDKSGVHIWKRLQDNNEVKGFIKTLLNEEHYTKLGMEFLKEIKCRKCNRDLTDPESIKLGIGPICRKS